MKRLARKPASRRVLCKVGCVLQFQRPAAEPAPAVGTVRTGVRDRKALDLKPCEGFSHHKADLGLPSSRIRRLTGHVVPKFVFEIARVVATAEIRTVANEEQQLSGQFLWLQGEQYVGVRDRLAELQHTPPYHNSCA